MKYFFVLSLLALLFCQCRKAHDASISIDFPALEPGAPYTVIMAAPKGAPAGSFDLETVECCQDCCLTCQAVVSGTSITVTATNCGPYYCDPEVRNFVFKSY